MKKLYLILGFVLVALTACPQKPAQTFDEVIWAKKGVLLPDGTKLMSATTGVSAVTWAMITGKPVTFLPSAHTHLWSDITNNPANLTLDQALEGMNGLPVSPKTSAEISKIIVPAGKARIVYNVTDSVLQVFYGGKWHVIITDK